ncbi:protein-disulfide reductase DsbD [Orrella sp. 11846]|uniref:protein-disulfide reductase DsbD n=1 Tax=Orrella sp. 11846 TaxID=3409913 RepID=UPI003B5BABC7
MRKIFVSFTRLLFGLFFVVFMSGASAQDFLAPEKAFVFQAQVNNSDELVIQFKIADGYYMYQERLSIEAQKTPWPVAFGEMPAAIVDYDPTFDKDMHLYFDAFAVDVALPAWPEGIEKIPFAIDVTSQGCAKAGICYPPMLSRVTLQPTDDGYAVISQRPYVDPFEDTQPSFLAADSQTTADKNTENQSSDASWWSLWQSADDTDIADALVSAGVGQLLLLFFALGLLLAFTPCVLPMVPVLSALIVGQSETISRRDGFLLSVAYVAGMSVIYTLLGVLAGMSGASLAAWLQTPWVLSVFAILLAIFGLAMFDIVRIEMPAGIQSKLTEKVSKLSGGRITVAAATGAVSALILGPCVAAPLAGALLYISYTGDVLLGGGALFAMSWGMGVPLILVGISAGSILPKAGQWMEGVKTFFGVLLIATAWWMMDSVLPVHVIIVGWVLLAFFSAILLGVFEPLPSRDTISGLRYLLVTLKKTLGLFVAAIGLIWLLGVSSGGQSLIRPLWHLTSGAGTVAGQSDLYPVFEKIDSVSELDRVLQESKQPILLDFYADWCISCKEMEALTFTSPEVQVEMQKFRLIQADVTDNTRQHRELLRRFNLFGPPGIIFFDADGRELKRPRVIGFQNAQRFQQTLEEVLNP